MRTNLLVGGPQDLIPVDLVKKRQAENWIGVDHGASLLLKWGITPQIAVGDFDSTNQEELARLKTQLAEIKVYPPAKDFTDTQLGVRAAIAELAPSQIDILGATGGRLDQLLANLYLPLQEEFIDYLPHIRFIDQQNIVDYYLPGDHEVRRDLQMDYLAFVNLTPVQGLTLPDEKYRLNNWDGDIPFSWSSNRFTAPINHFSFTRGVVAVIQSRDQK